MSRTSVLRHRSARALALSVIGILALAAAVWAGMGVYRASSAPVSTPITACISYYTGGVRMAPHGGSVTCKSNEASIQWNGTGEQGPPGPPGPPGPDGPIGPTGAAGANGVSGWEIRSSGSFLFGDIPGVTTGGSFSCSPGKRILGGGFSNSDGTRYAVEKSGPNAAGTDWEYRIRSVSGSLTDLASFEFWAVCASV